MNRHIYISILLLGCYMVLSGHIGSPNIIYQGKAGDYDIIANIQPPEVIPGTAQISVRVDSDKIKEVAIQGIYFREGSEGAPPPEALSPVVGDDQLFSGEIWLMSYGSASVKIIVDGWQGPGSTVIPVPSLPTATKEMDSSLGIVLAILGFILFAGAVTLVYASVGEATLSPGTSLPKSKQRKALITAFVSIFFFSWLVYFGSNWWNSEDNAYRKRLYNPIRLNTEIHKDGDQTKLLLNLDEPPTFSRRLSYRVPGDLIPDHGKLIHLFLVSEGDMQNFAHIHPVKIDSVNFQVVLPTGLPGDTYHIFADIVHQNGLSETLTASREIPSQKEDAMVIPASSVEKTYVDPEDSWYGYSSPEGYSQSMEDQTTITWERKEDQVFVEGQVQSLKFSVANAQGLPIAIEPYLGMLGHSVVMREDAEVFIHLHPVGTVSMAAQEALADRVNDELLTLCLPLDSLSKEALALPQLDPRQATNMQAEILKQMEARGLTHEVSFPYAFPKPGSYRVWVQIKYWGEIHTAGFDVEVQTANNTV